MHPATPSSADSDSKPVSAGAGSEEAVVFAPPGPHAVFVVGDYLVGDAEDELLSGHPDIRY